MADTKVAKRPFVGLQFKILLPLMFLFAVILAVCYFALDGFIKNMIMETFQGDIRVVSNEVGKCLDANLLVGMLDDAVYNEDGEWPEAVDDSRYQNQVNECLQSITESSERSLAYTYFIPEPGDQAFVGVDSDSVNDPGNIWAWGTLLSDTNSQEYPLYVRGMSDLTFDPDYTISEDQVMVKGYAPVYGEDDEILIGDSGQPMVGVVVEMGANAMLDRLVAIKTNLLLGLVVAFVILLVIVFLITLGTTASLRRLTHATDRVGEGNYDLLTHGRGLFADETTHLADTFNIMIGKVRGREESLKQQVHELQIIIDMDKKEKQVEEVTGSEFFQDLQSRARDMRRKRGSENSGTPTP